jgi:hypothetical protein
MGYPDVRTEAVAAWQLTFLLTVVGGLLGAVGGCFAPYFDEDISSTKGAILFGSIVSLLGFAGGAFVFRNERMHDETTPTVWRKKRKA